MPSTDPIMPYFEHLLCFWLRKEKHPKCFRNALMNIQVLDLENALTRQRFHSIPRLGVSGHHI